jgi:phosphomevalonate kinase
VSSRGTSAPGKAFLCGEYAVLSGAPAIVSAVDRRVVARWTRLPPGAEVLPPEAEATLAAAREDFGQPPHHLSFDTQRLYDGPNKLGLGSSAAVAVASAAAVVALRGHDLTQREVRNKVFAIALRGHSTVAPGGSGADVAAATYGGYVCFQKHRGAPSVQPIELPPSLTCLLIWTGKSARTSDLLAHVSRLGALEPKVHDRYMAALIEHATEFADAFQSGDGRGVIRKAREYHACMSALGAAAQAPIVNAELRRIAEWAWWHGGAAKPCGAGGGDLAVAFFLDRGAAEDFAAVCENDGLTRVHADWGAEGVRAHQQSDKPLQEMSFGSTS